MPVAGGSVSTAARRWLWRRRRRRLLASIGPFQSHGVGYMSALQTLLAASSASCLCKADGVRFTQCYAWPLLLAAIRLVRQCFHVAASYVAVLFVGVCVCVCSRC